MSFAKSQIKDLTYNINGAAIEVHKDLGPGLLESVYHKCLIRELSIRSINFKSELTIALEYKGYKIDTELRCDLFIENTIALELKSVEKIIPIHEAQVLSYMNLLNAPFGILINFNCSNIINEGQKTYVNELYRLLNN